MASQDLNSELKFIRFNMTNSSNHFLTFTNALDAPNWKVNFYSVLIYYVWRTFADPVLAIIIIAKNAHLNMLLVILLVHQYKPAKSLKICLFWAVVETVVINPANT
jgi:hypothetical protein